MQEVTGGTIEGLRSRCSLGDVRFEDTKVRLQTLFGQGVPIVAIMAAGALIVQEAGGRITKLNGNPLEIEVPDMLSSNGSPIHNELIQLFANE